MDWITTSMSNVLLIIITAVGIYLAVTVFTRLNGLRTYSKMSSFDFAVTVAVGSVIAGTALSKTEGILNVSNPLYLPTNRVLGALLGGRFPDCRQHAYFAYGRQ